MKKQFLVCIALFLMFAAAALGAQQQPAVPADFVRIEGGTFTMGSPASEPEISDFEGPQHQVTVGSFYMGKYEVTQKEYEAAMGTNPSDFKGAKLPVENVSWYDAIEYCNKRSEWEGLNPAYTVNKVRVDPNNENSDDSDNIKWLVTWNKNANGYRLPTEAEWEYACRAGLTSTFNTGSNITTAQANYDGRFSSYYDGTAREKTTDVGTFAANGGAYTICTETYWNGAGTGTGLTPVVRRSTLTERSLATSAYFGAARGATAGSSSVRRTGGSTFRPFGSPA